MPGRKAKDNVMKAMLLTHAAHGHMSTDAEKAFDRVAWDYMLAVCGKVGLGTHMMARISALYQTLTAKLKINRTLSDSVLVTNGTRQ